METLSQAVDALNGEREEILYVTICTCFLTASCLSLVPQKGTLGASGDLAPLSHLALGLMGEGQMWSAKTGWSDAATVSEQLQLHHI